MENKTRALYGALRAVYRLGQVHCCFFHYMQAVFRKARELGIITAINNNAAAKRFLRKYYALMFLPSQHIAGALASLEAKQDAVFVPLGRYVRRWFFDNVGQETVGATPHCRRRVGQPVLVAISAAPQAAVTAVQSAADVQPASDDQPAAIIQPTVAVCGFECLICMDRARTHIFIPCGHFVVCGDCVDKLDRMGERRCVYCRQQVQTIARVHYCKKG